MLPANSDLAQRLRAPGYFIATTALLIQLVELSFRGWPPRIHSPAWRITWTGAAADVVTISLLFFFVLMAIAILSRDRVVLYVLASLTAVGAVGLIAASAGFALDVLQMRGQVRIDRSQQYNVISVWVLGRMLVGSIGFALLAIRAFRSASALGRRTVGPPAMKSPLLVAKPVTAAPTAPKPNETATLID